MPGIAMDGSEDLPNRFISDSQKHLGICPFCYECATHMAKDMVGTHFCRNGHQWEKAYSLLAIPSNARPREAPEENLIYGRCPICYTPGIERYLDGVGTTLCKDGHKWIPTKKQNTRTEQKPVATEQKPVYDPSHEVIQQLLKAVEDLTNRVKELEAEIGIQDRNEYRNYRDQQTELYIGQGYGRKLAKGMAHHDCNVKFGKR